MYSLSAVCCKQYITLMPSLSFFRFFRLEEAKLDTRWQVWSNHATCVTCRWESSKQKQSCLKEEFYALKTKREATAFNNWTKWMCLLWKNGNSIGSQPCASSLADSCRLEKCFKALWLSCLLQIPWQKFIRRKVTCAIFGDVSPSPWMKWLQHGNNWTTRLDVRLINWSTRQLRRNTNIFDINLHIKLPPPEKNYSNSKNNSSAFQSLEFSLVGGWTNPSEKFAQVKIGNHFPK